MKLKDLLSALKTQINQDPQTVYTDVLTQIRQEHVGRKANVIKWIAGCLVSLLSLTGVGLYTYHYFKFDPSSNITGDIAALSKVVYIQANHFGHQGTTANTTVTVVTKESMSVNELSQHLSVSPAVPYTLDKKGTNRFLLTFKEDLEENTSYTVNSVIEDSIVYRWSLQTGVSFGIESVSPQNSASEVECDTTIQVTFTESGVNAFQEYFSIYPQVEGDFTHKGRIWTFTPKKPLDPYTTYTVTISGEIYGNEEITLGEDYSFSFTAGANDDRYAYVVNDTFDIADTFSTTTPPSVTVCAKGMTSTTADMTLYKIPDTQTYLELHKKYGHTAVISSAIIADVKEADSTVHSQFSVSAIPDPEQNGTYYFNYPKELESGYYVTEILWNGIKCYQLLQSNDLAVYAANLNDDYIVWVNNAQTGLPISGVRVEVGELSKKTDESGLATLTPEVADQTEVLYITVKADSLLPYIVCCKAEKAVQSDMYNHYLYTDSTVYQPNDTIKLWGSVTKRYDASVNPEVTITTGRDNVSYTVELQSNSSFESEIPLKNEEPGAFTVMLEINGEVCLTKSLTIIDDQLPSYHFSAAANKHAYLDGETASFAIKASFSDQLPASNLSVKIKGQTAVLTDSNGNATQNISLSYANGQQTDPLSTCAPVIYNAKINAISADNTVATVKQPILIFKTNEYISGTLTNQTSNSCTLDIRTNKIDFTKLNQLDQAAFETVCGDLTPEQYLGAATNKDVTVEIHDISFERKQSGTYFDTKSNKIQLKYTYTEKDTVVKTEKVQTKDGKMTLEDFSIPSPSGYRYLKLIMKDAAGKECAVKIYIDNPIDHDAANYKFDCPANAAYEQEINLAVYDPSGKQTLQDGTFIYHLYNGVNAVTGITEENGAKVVYAKSLGSEFSVFGAYFDGQAYHPVVPTAVAQSDEVRKISLTVSSDKDNYLPGEAATLTVQAKDATGDPIKNAAVNINITDALSTSSINTATMLTQLTNDASPVIYTTLPFLKETAEKDTATEKYSGSVFFQSNKTDKNGQLALTVTFPEQVDSWTVTAQAITQNGQVGCTQAKIATKKDLAVACYMTEACKPTDDAVISFNCSGNSINETSPIQSDIVLYQGTAVKDKRSLQHGTGIQYVNFGKLPTGEYSVKITANIGKTPAVIEKHFSVKDSTQAVQPTQEFDKATDTVATALLTDKENTFYVEQLSALLADGGMRIDKVLGREFATTVFDGKNVDDSIAIAQLLKNYQVNGGYASYPNAEEPDLLLTAKIVSLFPEQINKTKTNAYFNRILSCADSTNDEVFCALWGKAALNEAVEKDLAYYYAEGNGFTSEQQLYFALAYAYCGNQAKAYDIYTNRLKTMLTVEDETAFLTPDDTTRSEHCNSMLCLLLTRISAKEAPQVLKHVLTTDSETTLASLASIGYVKEFIPLLEGENTIQIGIADVGVKTVQYSKCSPTTVKINAEIDEIAIQDEQQATLITVNTDVDTKTIQSSSKKLGKIASYIPAATQLGADVSINLSITPQQAVTGNLHITLPYGLRYQSFKTSATDVTVSAGATENEIIISAESTKNIDITLSCKAVLPGEFVFEPALILSKDNSGYYSTDPVTLQITDPATAPVTEEVPAP